MNNQAKKFEVLERVVAALGTVFSQRVRVIDYEIQDDFRCVLVRAKVTGDYFSIGEVQEREAYNIFKELDKKKISWVMVFLDESGKVMDAMNSDMQ